MKKHFIYITLLACSISINAQSQKQTLENEEQSQKHFEEPKSYGKNEVCLNLFSLTTSDLNISYERIFNISNSVGISLLKNLDNNNYRPVGIHKKAAITPYYRMYLLNRKNYGSSGFFIEAITSISSLENTTDPNGAFFNPKPLPLITKSLVSMSLGASIGKKWINSTGLSIEVSLGFETFLSNNLGSVGRGSISIGKRF